MDKHKILLPEGDPHYESPRRRRGRRKTQMQPPMTPMIDVTFQLLIFFLLATNFRNEGNVPGSIPKVGEMSGQKTDVKPFFVVVRQLGVGADARPVYSIDMDGESMIEVPEGLSVGDYRKEAAMRLALELKRIHADMGEKVPVIVYPKVEYSGGGAPYVRWQFALEAYTQASKEGFKEIGFKWQRDAG